MLAAGDCAGLPYTHLAFTSRWQGTHAAKNVLAILTKGTVHEYRDLGAVIAVTVGRNGGEMNVPWFNLGMLGSLGTWLTKARDVFVSRERAAFGLT